MGGAPIDDSRSLHLKYAFRRAADSFAPTAYQGVGISYHTFADTREVGNPGALYIFQGARLARLGPRMDLNYEWNFGLSFGWTPFDVVDNSFNLVIGSEVCAYLNADFYFSYRLANELDLTAGLSISHFSNGNTRLPNAGLNTAGATLGMVYHFGREEGNGLRIRTEYTNFQRGMRYEALFFGSWRRKIVRIDELYYAAPRAYGVAGFSGAALMKLSRKISLGASLDGVYDSSANTYAVELPVALDETGEEYDYISPSWHHQWSLGVAAQVDYAMPFFTVSFGLGVSALNGGGDMKGTYQKLALKTNLTPHTFLHVGYSLRKFNVPNFLMLGVGVRFN
jgi:hypothetical protein